MIEKRITAVCLSLGLHTAVAGWTLLSLSCSLEADVPALAVSERVEPVPRARPDPALRESADERSAEKKDGDELESAYSDLNTAYLASKRAALEDDERRRKTGEQTSDSEIKNVAHDYWPRFQALADKGSGHARLWMALEMQSAFKTRERALNQTESSKLLEAVVAENADAPWIGELAKSLTALYIILPEENVDRIVDALAAKSTRKDVVAEALFRSATFDKASKREGATARADEIMKRLQRDYADTEYGKKARGDEVRAIGLKVGNIAPEFTTQDADGVTFKLSDYRGKVIVLDFWGFW